jgi:hypothetical protein
VSSGLIFEHLVDKNHQPFPAQRSFSRLFQPARDFSAVGFPIEGVGQLPLAGHH